MEQTNIPIKKMKQHEIGMKHRFLLLFGTMLIVSFAIMLNIRAAPQVEMIYNTDFCGTDCFTAYKICPETIKENLIKDLDFSVNFRSEKETLKKDTETIKGLISTNTKTSKDKIDSNCFIVNITGIKNKFANIDNVLFYDGVYYDQWAWWNTTFKYKKMINVSTTGTTVSNYQVLLNISYESGMQNDFDDIRFLDSSETAQLTYWIGSKIDGAYANVWVKSNSSITTTPTTIWLYYGDPAAQNETNGFDTFIFFDDFEDGDNKTRSVWTEGYKVGNCGMSVQIFGGSYIQNLSAVSSSAECNILGGSNIIPIDRNHILEMDIYQDYDENIAGYGPHQGFSESGTERTFVAFWRPDNDIQVGSVNGGAFGSWNAITTNANPVVSSLDQWIHFRTDRTMVGTNISVYISHGKGNFVTIYQGVYANSALNNNGSVEIGAIRGTSYWDNIFLREHHNFPVSIDYGGEQELDFTITSPVNITYFVSVVMLSYISDFVPQYSYYSHNGGANVSFNETANITSILGNNFIDVWLYENNTGQWFLRNIGYVAVFESGIQGNISITFNVDANADQTITNYICVNNDTLKIESNTEYCAGKSGDLSPACYWVNKTKYQNCAYGCYPGVVENGDYCSPPDYILWGFGLIVFFVAIFMINRYYRGR